ncbi:MAG: DNA repair and recombination protein RadA [Promethearchaeota archaeon]
MVELEDLPGVGPATAAKLKEAGYTSLEALAVASPKELSTAVEIGESTAQKIVQAAREQLEIGYSTALDFYEVRKSVGRITTGSEQLDALFGGGVETNAITELFGEFRAGKTQICHQLCIKVQLPPEKGGLNGSALYVDTEGTFRPERLVQMMEPEGLELEPTLQNIIYARAYNSDHQILLIEEAPTLIQEKNIKLVIVDALTSYFRSEYIGRGTLAERQQKLNKHLHQLLRLAEVHNLAVVATNQVMAKPDMFFGDPTTPVGGHIVAHACTTRVYLRKSKGDRRVARVVDSPCLPEAEAVFVIKEEGIGDA